MTWLSLLPPLLAISIALLKREVVMALLLAIVAAELILAGGQPLTAFLNTVERLVAVFADAGNVRILLFSLLIGALLAWFRHSGGVDAFILRLEAAGLARSPRSAGLLTWTLGVAIFIESNLSILASGSFARKLYDSFHMSRARLALMIDTTCAPVSILILLNGWGAYVLGLLAPLGLEDALGIMLASVPLNFYALGILALAFHTAWSCRVYGALARYESAVREPPEDDLRVTAGKARYFLAPMLVLVLGMALFMTHSGGGNPVEGDGAASVLYATISALMLCYVLLLLDRRADHATLVNQAFEGMGQLLPVVGILLLAFALGATMGELQTGAYIASLLPQSVPLWLLAPAVFLTACFTSFTTGTSWGTFGILIPVVIPLALGIGAPPALLLAATLGGGVFGDHCSPISDSTVLASLASGCDHATHVRTQLPYALAAGAAAVVLYAIVGLVSG